MSPLRAPAASAPPQASCLYQGWVRHRRYAPRPHAFRYRMFQAFLDLDELDRAFAGSRLASARRPALAWFRRADHVGDPEGPLAETVRDLVAGHTGRRPRGPIRLLTHLRTLGFCFNPVSFYYLYPEGAAAPDRAAPETIVAEVDNTPWGERHCYVLDGRTAERVGPARVFRFDKAFHVSPFLPMEMGYDWRFTDPGRRLLVHMENLRDGRRVFDATLVMTRRALTPAALRSCLLRYPAMTARVYAAIYWQALRLWLERAPFHDHPGARSVEVSGPAVARDEGRRAVDG
ncbi:MAG TPA: DUF1365 domain-containing protein [Thermoanaerobaculia bacterium]|nr:DUF1365 domain-containing protein [Thermoanaerobaculia bacterium]